MVTQKHVLDRSTSRLDEVGVKVQMFCAKCEEFVDVYTTGKYVRCAESVRKYYKRPPKMEAPYGTKKQPFVEDNDDMVKSFAERIRRWDVEQKGCCAMCNGYVRMSRNGKRDQLYVVVTGKNKYLRGSFCWDCRSSLVRHNDKDWVEKANLLPVVTILEEDDS